MHLPFTLTPYTCGLSALESYFTDIGFAWDQCRILRERSIFCIPEDPNDWAKHGMMNTVRFSDLCMNLGFSVALIPALPENQLRGVLAQIDLAIDGVFILATNWAGHFGHCVRFGGWPVGAPLRVIVPRFRENAEDTTVSYADLATYGYQVIRIWR